MKSGFTLVELSIVLVIIGLIIGGVLTGRDLVAAATVRAQVGQIEKFHTATNTFKGKYGYLPGDIPNPVASQYGFQTRGNNIGTGDGNGILEGVVIDFTGNNNCCIQGTGENVMVWRDLSEAGLIEGGFTTASPSFQPSNTLRIGGQGGTVDLALYYPKARLGGPNVVLAYNINGVNYFNVRGVDFVSVSGYLGNLGASTTVQEAYNIDRKVDDGMPQTGTVLAVYDIGAGSGFDFGWTGAAVFNSITPFNTATTGTANTCFDNGGVSGSQHYSTEMNSGNGLNCALSFRF